MKWIVVTVVLMLPLAAVAIVEPDTGTGYPDTVGLDLGGETVTLEATGVALREKTFLKIDVYTIVSYVVAGADLGDEPHRKLRELDAPKRVQMDLRRGFSREKLINSFREVIEKNHDDLSPIARDMDTFMAYFDRDAREGDRIVFSYAPDMGLVTVLNGETRGTIHNEKFVVALWTVWFGEEPADEGMRNDLLSALAQ